MCTFNHGDLAVFQAGSTDLRAPESLSKEGSGPHSPAVAYLEV